MTKGASILKTRPNIDGLRRVLSCLPEAPHIISYKTVRRLTAIESEPALKFYLQWCTDSGLARQGFNHPGTYCILTKGNEFLGMFGIDELARGNLSTHKTERRKEI